MSQPHVIQLNGPWEIAALSDNPDAVETSRINIRRATDWAQIGDLITKSAAKRLQLSRKFNWPAIGAAHIQLEISGSTPVQLLLNDRVLEFTAVGSRVIAEVTDPQPTGNQLVICYDQASFSAGSPALTGVCLKISDAGRVKQ